MMSELKDRVIQLLENAQSDLTAEIRNVKKGICKYSSVKQLRLFIQGFIDEIDLELDDLEYDMNKGVRYDF